VNQKGFFNKGVVEKQGGAAIVLTSLTEETIKGGCFVPGLVHIGINIGKPMERFLCHGGGVLWGVVQG